MTSYARSALKSTYNLTKFATKFAKSMIYSDSNDNNNIALSWQSQMIFFRDNTGRLILDQAYIFIGEYNIKKLTERIDVRIRSVKSLTRQFII
ncbi:unnamed protein product [marine sediment metagenome]|uniref:Uncharacterized protein n=1 Tax=marine sediment metagenome TaxID=412755 RepID=X1C631_9ZZZZ